MPIINDRYYMNPAYGMALERARLADSSTDPSNQQGSGTQQGGGASDNPFGDFGGNLQNSPPQPTQISPTLSVHDLGLMIYNETRSFSDRSDSNESIDDAREKFGHVIINGDREWGPNRQKNASTALPVEPSSATLTNPQERAAYNSSMQAAQRAAISPKDPTGGALHMNTRGDARRSNWMPPGMQPPGKPLKTQSGPYNNVYTKGDTPTSSVWLNTYER